MDAVVSKAIDEMYANCAVNDVYKPSASAFEPPPRPVVLVSEQ